ncbi:Crp/Fnr family transcriptional regulator [Chitinophaga sp. OAE865]|uniref:Crp/Fnr family transcriptional regulator n=1 Tax=Chitinophaga sp. OAE865 TaxID=2817898 RepID=UPI001AE3E2FF
MNKESLVQFIQQVLPMSQAKAGQVVEKFKPMQFERNGHVLEAGKVCHTSHFIEKGIIRSYTYDVDGNEVTTAFYPENTFTNDLLSFFKRSPAKEYLQAVTGCETWYITYEDMQASFHTIPEFREFGRLNIVNQYSTLKERMLSMLQETAEQRYSNLINSSPGIFQHVPLKYIASYLGITDTSLSRIRKEFARKAASC